MFNQLQTSGKFRPKVQALSVAVMSAISMHVYEQEVINEQFACESFSISQLFPVLRMCPRFVLICATLQLSVIF